MSEEKDKREPVEPESDGLPSEDGKPEGRYNEGRYGECSYVGDPASEPDEKPDKKPTLKWDRPGDEGKWDKASWG